MPYVRAASSMPPPGFAVAGAVPPPPYVPQQYAPPVPAPLAYAAANPFAAPPAPMGYAPTGFAPPVYGNPPPPQGWPAKLGLVVPQYAVETGDLPRICVVSGVPTERMKKLRWIWAPSWVAIFIVVGLIPYLIVREFAGDKVSGYLPLHPSVSRRFNLQRWGGIVGFLAGFVLLIASAAQSSGLLALLGLAVLIGGVVLACQPGRVLKVKRAAPGYLAIPKASPAFAAAFRAGRPTGQFPHTATPAKFGTRKVFIVLGVVMVPLIAIGVFAAIGQSLSCRPASVHPNRAQVSDALTADNQSLGLLAASNGGPGWTPAQGQQVLTADATMTATLQALTLKPEDRIAVDGYLGTVSQFDQSLRVYMASGSAADETAFVQAGGQRDAVVGALAGQLNSVPADCANSN
jgi:hypothetical protein